MITEITVLVITILIFLIASYLCIKVLYSLTTLILFRNSLMRESFKDHAVNLYFKNHKLRSGIFKVMRKRKLGEEFKSEVSGILKQNLKELDNF